MQPVTGPSPGWVDAFVMERDAVTNDSYLLFLNHLMETGRHGEVRAYLPSQYLPGLGEQPVSAYRLEGRSVVLVPPEEGGWRGDWPVMGIDFHAASAYAGWRAQRDQLPWRLPQEFEFEKAARGVDGRAYPWGDFFDARWCRTLGAASSDSSPSPWGRCRPTCRPTRPRPQRNPLLRLEPYQRPSASAVAGEATVRLESSLGVQRGGAWNVGANSCRIGVRHPAARKQSSLSVGIRLVRSFL